MPLSIGPPNGQTLGSSRRAAAARPGRALTALAAVLGLVGLRGLVVRRLAGSGAFGWVAAPACLWTRVMLARLDPDARKVHAIAEDPSQGLSEALAFVAGVAFLGRSGFS
jgi:hypothetical protein